MHKALRPEPDRPKSVLLIDIDGISGRILNSLVESTRKYRLIITRTFADGMLCQKQNECDVILLACNKRKAPLPKIIQKLHQFRPEVPIIALGINITEQYGEELIEAHAFDYISVTKYSTELLNRAIRYAILSAEQQQKIVELRDTDALTGLGNRQLFLKLLAEKLEHNEQSSRKLAIISIDINNFRSLNSRFGQHSGDKVVEEMGKRISSSVPEDTLVARLGNDEFALIVECSPYEDAKRVVSNMLKNVASNLHQPFRYGHNEMQINCSMGIAFSPEHGFEVEQLIHRAVLARQESKKAFETRFTFFHEGLDDKEDLYSDLAPEIAHALRSNQFVLHYQPQIDVRTGQIIGAETLIRWNHPERGLLYPDSFIPLCEQVGLIVPIGYWIIHQACLDLNTLQKKGIFLKHLGVNLSFRQFGDDQLVPTIKRILERTGVDTSVLELELTESTLHDDEDHILTCLDSLSEAGLSFSLDDFGTGYSSFSLLQKLPIDTIKIDRSFITDVTTSEDDAKIVRAIINLSHNMGKKVIAEGVETQNQLDFLVENNCDMVQGYFFSRPVEFSTFKHTLEHCAEAV